MNQNSRTQAWEKEVADWKENQAFAYHVTEAYSKLFEDVIAKLKESGIDLQPVLDQFNKDLGKLTIQRGKEK